jgi:hypothetical protein
MSSLTLVTSSNAPPRAAFAGWFAAVLVTLFVLLLSWRTPDCPRAGRA